MYVTTFTTFLLNRSKMSLSNNFYPCLFEQEQYIFVYDALLEALKAGNTAIGCSEFRDEFERLKQVDAKTGKSKLQEQFAVSTISKQEC